MDHQARQAGCAVMPSSRKWTSRRPSSDTRCRSITPSRPMPGWLPRPFWPSWIGAEMLRAPGGAARRRASASTSGDNHNAPYQDTSSSRFIDPRTLSKAVDTILPRDRVVASDSGHFCGWVPRFLRVPKRKASCLSHSFQSVGLGLGSAIGLAIANPGSLAVLGAGDGGFLMSLADLETAVRLKLRMCILVYNDCFLCSRSAPLPASRLYHRYRAVPRHRLCRHRAGSRREGRHRQDPCRSRAGAGLGARRVRRGCS